MSFYLKMNGEQRQANNPKIIFQGKCEGIVEIAPGKDSLDNYIDNWKHRPGGKNAGRIFICESITMSLRPLIPYACGFLFGDGTNLSHFANILRQHNICACIDKGLWHWAFDTAKNRKNSISAEFVCGEKKVYLKKIKEIHRDHLRTFFRIIEEKVIVLPVYDVKKGVFQELDEIHAARLGFKALSVNALKRDGFSVPDTLILCRIPESLKTEVSRDRIWAALQNIFPELESPTGRKYMVRASLYTTPESREIVSGMIKTASFQTRAEFENIFRKYSNTWATLCSSTPCLSLSIIIQERVPACIFGVVFTRLPWDYSRGEMIFDLSLQDTLIPDSGRVQVTLKNDPKVSKDQHKRNLCRELAEKLSHVLPFKYKEDRFYTSLSVFLIHCIELQEHYRVPLDIEFAVTDEFQVYYTQLRHIYFM